jgi:hypothetical protein
MMNDNTTPTVKVGDLFNMSWGWEQTNNNFFEVVRVTPKGAYVREIEKRSIGSGEGMCNHVAAVKGSFLARSQWCGNNNVPKLVRIKNYNGKPYFMINGRYMASLTNETELHYNSWYA